jgi:hypothetical protein
VHIQLVTRPMAGCSAELTFLSTVLSALQTHSRCRAGQCTCPRDAVPSVFGIICTCMVRAFVSAACMCVYHGVSYIICYDRMCVCSGVCHACHAHLHVQSDCTCRGPAQRSPAHPERVRAVRRGACDPAHRSCMVYTIYPWTATVIQGYKASIKGVYQCKNCFACTVRTVYIWPTSGGGARAHAPLHVRHPLCVRMGIDQLTGKRWWQDDVTTYSKHMLNLTVEGTLPTLQLGQLSS